MKTEKLKLSNQKTTFFISISTYKK